MKDTKIENFAFVDALRGWAVIGVILVHTYQWIPCSSETLGTIAKRGAFGVQLFYIISAFTLFLSLSRRYFSDTSPFICFFIRRFFRIAPLFYLAILFYSILDGLGPRFWAPNGVGALHIILTALFLHGWMPR